MGHNGPNNIGTHPDEGMRLSVNRESKVWQWVLQRTRDRIISGLRRRRSHPDVVEAGANGPLL